MTENAENRRSVDAPTIWRYLNAHSGAKTLDRSSFTLLGKRGRIDQCAELVHGTPSVKPFDTMNTRDSEMNETYSIVLGIHDYRLTFCQSSRREDELKTTRTTMHKSFYIQDQHTEEGVWD
jgi:hypothetical protein